MFRKQLICGAVLMAFSVSGFAASKGESKPAAKVSSKASAKATPQRLKGKTETLACRLGTEDRHARIAVVLIGGKTDSFAYYSKWKPRTCSIYLQRFRDSYSKWADNGNITTVDLERGAFLIEHKKGEYHFIFRDIDRERYCGMEGLLNGSLTIRKGSEQCQLDGEIMVEGTPLGEAFVNREEDKPPPGLMPGSVPASTAQAEAAAAPVAAEQPASPVKPASSTQQTAKPAGTTASPTVAAEKPAAKAAPSAVAVEKPAAKAAPSTVAAEKPAGDAAPSTVTAEKPAVNAVSPKTAAEQPAADAGAAATASQKSAATAVPKATEKKAAESGIGNTLRSFFGSFSQTHGPEKPAQSE